MRHERISQASIAAAAWPGGLEGLVLTEPEAPTASDLATPLPSPAPAVPDVAAGVGGLIIGAYAALIGVFFALFAGSLASIFALVIALGFVVMFFSVPAIFLKVEGDQSRRPSMGDFMYDGIQTLTGHSSGKDALVQMLIVPVLLTFCILVMGIAAKIYL